MQINTIYNLDCREGFKLLDDNSIDCCVSSPPYYALRDYGVKGQIGLEQTPEEFIQNLVEVYREIKRVLKPEGTIWINIGDSYNGYKANTRDSDYVGNSGRPIVESGHGLVSKSLKNKDLIGIPWMLAFALRSDGWYLRQDIIWHKPNPMPESVNDRCTKSHEYIFLLSKSPKYYYNAYAIATDYAANTYTTFGHKVSGNGDGSGLVMSQNWGNDIKIRKPKTWKTPDGWDTGSGTHGSFHRNGREKGKHYPRPGIDNKGGNQGNGGTFMNPSSEDYGKANKRSVWTVATRPFKEAHFATFPQELIVDCIKAGCPEDGIILDPFMGAGTTALVARKLNRNYIGFELNPKYVELSKRRLINELGIFQ
jgi:DNA modification methylase